MRLLKYPLISALLALVLAFTSVQMALARGQAAPAGEMVICTGTGPVSITVDADGQPTGPVHICPDCALSLIVALDEPEVLAPVALVWLTIDLPVLALSGTGISTPAEMARGPPLAI